MSVQKMQNLLLSCALTATVWYFLLLPNIARIASAIFILDTYGYIAKSGHVPLLSTTTFAIGAQKLFMKNNR